MPYKDSKAGNIKRKAYWREYHRLHRIRRKGTSIGYKAEELGLKILIGSERIYRPCDLKWEGKLIDVKTGIKHNSNSWLKNRPNLNQTYRWKFYLKQLRKVDLFLIICQDQEEKVEYIFLIPDKVLKTKNLSISENRINKFSSYRISLL